MPSGDSARIGGAHYEISADTAKLRSDVKESENVVKQSVNQQVSAFTGLIGKVTAVIGTFAAFVAIGEKIGELFTDNTEKIELFTQSLDFGNTAGSIDAVNKKIQELQNRLADQDSTYGFIKNLREGFTTSKITEELEKFTSLRTFLNTKSAKESATAEIDAAKKVQDEADRIRIGTVGIKNPEIAKRMEAEKAVADARERLNKRIADKASADELAAFEDLISALQARLAAVIYEAGLAAQKAIADAGVKAQGELRALQQQQESGYGFNSITRTMNLLRQDVRNLRGSIR